MAGSWAKPPKSEGAVALDTRQPAAGIKPRTSEPKRGRPRIGEARDKPWVTAGMSERTYYRRQAENREQGK